MARRETTPGGGSPRAAGAGARKSAAPESASARRSPASPRAAAKTAGAATPAATTRAPRPTASAAKARTVKATAAKASAASASTASKAAAKGPGARAPAAAGKRPAESSGKGKPETAVAAAVATVPVLRKKQLVERVAASTGAKKRDVKPVVEATLKILGNALASGEHLALPPFGKAKVNRQKDLPSGEMLMVKLRRPGPDESGQGG